MAERVYDLKVRDSGLGGFVRVCIVTEKMEDK